jgi:hypothetical protein
MDENLIKKKLIDIFSNDFDVMDEPWGKSFYGKKVRPDLGLRLKGRDELFIIEIKDDTALNFSFTQLLRQAATYKFAKYKDVIPTRVFVTTTNLLKNKFELSMYYRGEIHLANKLGVGLLSLGRDLYTEPLNIRLGNLFKYYIDYKESEVNPTEYKVCIGTKSKSNEIKEYIEFVKNTSIVDHLSKRIVEFWEFSAMADVYDFILLKCRKFFTKGLKTEFIRSEHIEYFLRKAADNIGLKFISKKLYKQHNPFIDFKDGELFINTTGTNETSCMSFKSK